MEEHSRESPFMWSKEKTVEVRLGVEGNGMQAAKKVEFPII